MESYYAILGNRRIVAITDERGLTVFNQECQQSAILLDPIQVPLIRANLQKRGGLSSSNMPTQYLDYFLDR